MNGVTRDDRAARVLDELSKDLRYGIRQLRRSPGFTLLATLTLAIGIGANTAIFSVVNTVLLEPLPYPEPDRLVMVWTRLDRVGIARNAVSPPELMDLFAHDSFEELSGFYDSSASLTTTGRPERVAIVLVSPGMFSMLGAEPALGRAFTPGEDQPGHEGVVVLSHGLWRRRFASRPDVAGSEIRLDGQSYVIVGVMPEGFRPPLGEADLWMPLAFRPEEVSEEERGSHYLDVVARLKPGVSLDQARQSLDALAERLDRDHPDAYRDAGFGISLGALHEELVSGARKPLVLLLGAVGFVLLIACANVANLLVARAVGREREIALRTALGARRLRVVRQLLGESMLLAALGGAAGVLVAVWGVDLLRALGPADLPRLSDVSIDGVVVLTCAVLFTCATGIAFGIAPALQLTASGLPEGLKEGARGATGGPRGSALRASLVVLETALALVLLIGASLLLRSLLALGRVDPGLDAGDLLTLRLALPAGRYSEEFQLTRFRRNLLNGVSALPGVRRAAVTSHLPLGGSSMSQNFTVEGPTALGEGPQELELQSYLVTPGYFETMGIPLFRGRDVSDGDTEASPLAVLIDETLAMKLWPDEDPVGKRIHTGGPEAEGNPWRTIVGVVGYVRHHRLDAMGREQLYSPFPQLPAPYARSLFVVVKTDRDPDALSTTVEKVIHDLDPELAVFDVRTMEERVAAALSAQRFQTRLLALFAATALLLSAIGVYGVMATAVEERRRETGVRIAMGARPGQVFGLVLRDGLAMAFAGIALGLVAAAFVARILASLLFEVSPLDGATFVVAPALLAMVALAAICVPARRAMRVDPIVALRHE